jgi:hypothetical protein
MHVQADRAIESEKILLHSIKQFYSCNAIGISSLLEDQPHLKNDDAGEQLLQCIKMLLNDLDPQSDNLETEKAKVIARAKCITRLLGFIQTLSRVPGDCMMSTVSEVENTQCFQS